MKKAMLLHCLLVTIVWLSSLHPANSECKAKYCSRCDATSATCETKYDIFPKDLPNASGIRKLQIIYKGEMKNITKSDFKNLKELHIEGSIRGIEELAFQNQKHLEVLNITETWITKFPDRLFSANSTHGLRILNLHRNKISEINSSQFLSEVPNLEVFNVGYNCLDLTMSTCALGRGFENLTNLTELDISGITVPENCNDTGKMLEHVPKSLKVLRVANTTGIFANPALLEDFTSLEHLDISRVMEYAKCPRNATQLFKHLPNSLQSIEMKWWSDITDKPGCILSAEDLKELKKLPRLEKLNFHLSEFIFGSNITRKHFDDFDQLTELNLGYCRISRIGPECFKGNSKLQTLILDGNLIGSGYIKLQSQDYTSTIQSLSLKSTGLTSDDTQVFHPVSKLINRNITKIDISGNLLRQCPLFEVHEDDEVIQYDNWCASPNPSERSFSVKSVYRPNLKTVILNNNFIKRFIPIKYFRLNTTQWHNLRHCDKTPNFTHLEMENNRLKELRGLCPSLKVLRLRDNDLDLAWNETNIYVVGGLWRPGTQRADGGLPNIEELDLSDNGLNYLPPELLANMTKLKILRLVSNGLQVIPPDSFRNNLQLEIIDFGWNRLTSFDHKLIASLPKLKELHLNDNLITIFEEKFLEELETGEQLKLVNLFGNPFLCDCDHDYLTEWIKRDRPSVELVRPKDWMCSDASNSNVAVVDYDFKSDLRYCQGIQALIWIGAALAIALVTALIVWPCYKYKWYVTHPRIVFKAVLGAMRSAKLEHEVEYDAFLSYDHHSDEDIEFIQDKLIPAIEAAEPSDSEPLSLYIHHRDMMPGAMKSTELAETLARSRKIIILLSNSYIRSNECKGEADRAGTECYGEKFYQPHKILVLVREPLNEQFFTAPITNLLVVTVINVFRISSERETKSVWTRARKFISKPKYNYKRKQSKGKSLRILKRKTQQTNSEMNSFESIVPEGEIESVAS